MASLINISLVFMYSLLSKNVKKNKVCHMQGWGYFEKQNLDLFRTLKVPIYFKRNWRKTGVVSFQTKSGQNEAYLGFDTACQS